MIIEKIKETDYGVLQESSAGWHEEENAYLSFVKYYMEVILSACKELSARVELMQDRSLSKPERIRALFARTLQKLSKNMILKKCPDISVSTVELTLAALAKEGRIKTGAGKIQPTFAIPNKRNFCKNMGDIQMQRRNAGCNTRPLAQNL